MLWVLPFGACDQGGEIAKMGERPLTKAELREALNWMTLKFALMLIAGAVLFVALDRVL